VVVAAGARSGQLLEPLGARIPMTAGKGYSITLDDPRFRLRNAISLGGIKVVCTPFDGGTRFSGTMELSGINERLDRRRLESIRSGVARYFGAALEPGAGVEWVGMRPLTPDGLPVIGPVRGYADLYLASGHSMLGVTLAPLTGDAVAALIDGESVPLLAPFDPARFN
jgi:D-amino-acid dehydrogenase